MHGASSRHSARRAGTSGPPGVIDECNDLFGAHIPAAAAIIAGAALIVQGIAAHLERAPLDAKSNCARFWPIRVWNSLRGWQDRRHAGPGTIGPTDSSRLRCSDGPRRARGIPACRRRDPRRVSRSRSSLASLGGQFSTWICPRCGPLPPTQFSFPLLSCVQKLIDVGLFGQFAHPHGHPDCRRSDEGSQTFMLAIFGPGDRRRLRLRGGDWFLPYPSPNDLHLGFRRILALRVNPSSRQTLVAPMLASKRPDLHLLINDEGADR